MPRPILVSGSRGTRPMTSGAHRGWILWAVLALCVSVFACSGQSVGSNVWGMPQRLGFPTVTVIGTWANR